ncbi:hypothetical protein D3C79_1119400 [compost metagenome]
MGFAAQIGIWFIESDMTVASNPEDLQVNRSVLFQHFVVSEALRFHICCIAVRDMCLS